MDSESKIREIIIAEFCTAITRRGGSPPTEFRDDLVLLESGLTSLGFAILVTTLEDKLGYDPFTLMDEPVYPRTFGEFTSIYLKFADQFAG